MTTEGFVMSGTEERTEGRDVEAILRDLATEEGQGGLTRQSPIGRLVAAVPSLLSECERLQAENAELRATVERYRDALTEVSGWRDAYLKASKGWERTAKSNGEMYDQTAAELAAVRRVVQAVEALCAKARATAEECTPDGEQTKDAQVWESDLRAALADPVGPPPNVVAATRAVDAWNDDTPFTDPPFGDPVGLPTTDEPTRAEQ